MFNFKEVSNMQFGLVKIVVTDEKRVLFCMQDICKLLSINLQDTRTKLDSTGIYEIPIIVNERKVKKLYIDSKNLETCVKLSTDENADAILNWLIEARNKAIVTYCGYSIEDLKDGGIAKAVLEKLRELETIVAVQKVRIEEDEQKVKLVDSLYGTKAPIDFCLINSIIKYRDISFASILEDLRNNGIFNEANLPHQKYLDEKYFRLVTVTTNIKTEEVTVTRVLVYQKGIRLVEDILKKKAGIKSERANIKVG